MQRQFDTPADFHMRTDATLKKQMQDLASEQKTSLAEITNRYWRRLVAKDLKDKKRRADETAEKAGGGQ